MKRTVFRIGKFPNREKFYFWLRLSECKLTEIKVHEARTLQFLFHVTDTVRTYMGNFMFINNVCFL